MEIAYSNLTVTPVAEFMAREAEDTRKKEQQVQAVSLGDTVAISEEAREKQRAQAAGESEDNKPGTEQDKKNGAHDALSNASSPDDAAASGSGDGPDGEVEKIQRQIREIQRKIADANNKLSAQQHAASNKASTPLGSMGSGEDSSTDIAQGERGDVQAIQAEVSQLNDQLIRLYKQLQDATRGVGSGGYHSTAMRSVAGSPYSGSGGGAANVSIGGGNIG